MKKKTASTKNTIASHSLRVLAGSIFVFLAVPDVRADLIGYWDFGYKSGGTVPDLSGYGNNATLGGTLANTTPGSGPVAVPAMQAVNFAGTNGSMTVPSSSSLVFASNTFTISMWINEDYESHYPRLFFTTAWELQANTFSDGDAFYLGKSPWKTTNQFNGFRGAWHNLAITCDGTNIRWYLDSTLKATVARGSMNFNGAWGTLEIATRTTRIQGKLGDVALFNSVEDVSTVMNRTQAEMQGYWNAGGSGPTYNWNTDTNWSGALPASARALTFDTSNGLTTNNNDFAANKQFAGMNFKSTAGAFTLSGNTVNLTGNVTNSSTATQTIGLNGLVLDGGTRTFNTASGDIIVSSNISQTNGTNGLTKIGNGVLTLAGTNNTYTGATLVSAGILRVSGTISGSAVTVQSGGTLGTSSGLTGGTVGAVTVQNNGTLAPGASTGLMTVAGNLTIEGGGIFAAEINATGAAGTNYDQVTVAVPAGDGAVNITGSTLTLSGSYLTTPSVTNDLFFILLNDGSDTITGTFNGLAEGAHVFGANGQDYLISYQADLTNTTSGNFGTAQGNDIALMAVPEPGAAVSLLGGLGLLLGVRRRRSA